MGKLEGGFVVMPDVCGYWDRKADVLVKSKYGDRIRWLLANNSLSRTSFGPGRNSNCYGTALWVLGAGERIHQYLEGRTAEFGQSKNWWDEEVVFPSTDRPFYVKPWVMCWFAENHCLKVERKKDTLLLAQGWEWGFEEVEYEALVHGGIYLGEETVFEQKDYGGEFRIASFQEVARQYTKLDYYELRPY